MCPSGASTQTAHESRIRRAGARAGVHLAGKVEYTSEAKSPWSVFNSLNMRKVHAVFSYCGTGAWGRKRGAVRGVFALYHIPK